ncbi:MAG: hypothetical protein EBU46_07665 [Nitrosomonadaceae bacterium]|nr:hypothetical protein [Nitrosomonadaceae bacterium]
MPNETETLVSTPKLGEYKGSATITFNPEDRFPFTLGIKKAKLLLQPENLAALQKFVASGGKECTP